MSRKARKKAKAKKGRHPRGRGASAPPPAPEGPPGWIFAVALVLVLVGLAASLYLGKVYLCAYAFLDQCDLSCNINETWDCGEVARSTYSRWLGIPLALYGIEFFTACLALVLLPGRGGIKLARWDSLLFCAMLIGLPVCALLGWVSITRLNKACIGCVTVYGVVTLLFISLLAGAALARGKDDESLGARLTSLLIAGPAELMGLLKPGLGGALVAMAVVLFTTQFLWVPRLLVVTPKKTGLTTPIKDLPVHDDLKGFVTSGLSIGPDSARVVIEEFTDFQCPYCAMGHKMMMQLVKRFKGKVKLIHRDFPLDNSCNKALDFQKHPQACRAAIYARCAAAENKYWPYEALLFPNQELLNEQTFKRFAVKVGLDMKKLQACVNDPTTKSAVANDAKEGVRRDIKGTPAYFINGKPLLDEKGERIRGFPKMPWWVKKIESLTK